MNFEHLFKLTPEQQEKADLVGKMHLALQKALVHELSLLKDTEADPRDILTAALTASSLACGDVLFACVEAADEDKGRSYKQNKAREGAEILARAAGGWACKRFDWEGPLN